MIAFGQGNVYFIAETFNDISGASSRPRKRRDNDVLLIYAIQRAVSFHDAPYILAGDFNCDPRLADLVVAATRARLLTDVFEVLTPKSMPLATFSRSSNGVIPGMSGAGVTRIDGMLLNPLAMHALREAEYLWCNARGADHVPLRVSFDLPAMNLKVL